MQRKGGVSAAGGGVDAGEDGGSRGRELHHGGERQERRRRRGAAWKSVFYASAVGKGLCIAGLGLKGPGRTEGGASCSVSEDTV